MEGLSAYQQMRKANLSENTQFLKEYGLQAPVVESNTVTLIDKNDRKKKPNFTARKKREKRELPVEERRTSFRVRLKTRQDYFEDYESLKDSDEEDEAELLKNLSQPNRSIVRPPRPNTYGSIQGVKVGTWWETRLDCNYDGIHRPTVAGIHPGPDGAYSVALSGGYEDDVDLGDSFTYTGEGGRDLKGTASNPKNLRTAPQSKHQTLVRGNLALSRNVETGNPVRVIRGYKLNSKFAPERGYRYDGLYKITKFWETTGKAGFRIYKFEFQRCDPEPAPWHKGTKAISPIQSESEDAVESVENGTVWHGWSVQDSLPSTDRLTIVFRGEAEHVCLTGDQWHQASDSHKNLHASDIVPLAPWDKTVERDSGMNTAEKYPESKITQTLENVEGLEDTKSSSPFSIDDKWCGWNEENMTKNYNCFTVKYMECAVRVCEEKGTWREIDFNEPELSCDQDQNSADVVNLFDWLGWPEGGFSVLNCPSTFNCILRENFN